MEVGKLPSNEFLLKFKFLRDDKWRISGGISPERLREERSREMIKEVFWAHFMPDQEHQRGEELDKIWVGFQDWREFCGSFRDDFRERREKT